MAVMNGFPKILIMNDMALTSSRDVADYFGKTHKDVLRKIESLGCSTEFAKRNFTLCFENNELQNGKPQPLYQITRDGFAFLAMGFTGKRAAQFKEAYINAFRKMECQISELPRGMLKIQQTLNFDLLCDFCKFLNSTSEINGMLIGNASIMPRAPRVYLYHAYLSYVAVKAPGEAMSLTKFGTEMPKVMRGLGAEYKKARTRTGIRSNLNLSPSADDWLPSVPQTLI
ncbi:Rha family transcriptional regulator [Escherichia coli]|nr:Rha family transcriptional regulator [Escherichia coli]